MLITYLPVSFKHFRKAAAKFQGYALAHNSYTIDSVDESLRFAVEQISPEFN